MTTRLAGGIVAALLFTIICATPAGADSDACWQLVYKAVEHSAQSPRAHFISYAESIGITQDGHPYERASANITYRDDDGLAYVDDDRWVHPFMSGVLEPGPPVLGPYGAHRGSWLSLLNPDATPGLPLIADTHTHPDGRCIDHGDEALAGGTYAHLALPDASSLAPALKAVWIDRKTLEVKRAIVSQWLTFIYDFSENMGKRRLIDYTIDLARVNGYQVVEQINWQYTYPVYNQFSTIEAEFHFGGYHFDSKPPVGTLFASRE